MKRLFLTGDMGCGKSTAIVTALGDKLPQCGGFLTRRVFREDGSLQGYEICSTNGSENMEFLVFFDGKPVFYPVSFETFGVKQLKGKVLVLDEIGGVELLCPRFREALEEVLSSGVPVLGVLKGENPQAAMSRRLALRTAYRDAVRQLYAQLENDPDTMICRCSKFDENALFLAREWVKEHFHE